MVFGKKRKPVKRKTTRKSPVKKTKSTGKKKPFGGYEIVPDEKFAALIGKAAVTPAQMTKKIWQYIKKHKLSRKG